MLVILKESIDKLGRTGDLVKVSDGYARNYLLPRNLVIVANESNRAALDHHKRVLEKKRATERSGAEELAEKLAQHSCTIKRKAGESDKLFGSVSAADVATELTKAGFKVEKRQVHIADSIRTLGVHPVTIKLQPEISATVKVWVVKEE